MLSNTAIAKLKPKDKVYLVADTAGLYVQVKPNGVKTFMAIFSRNNKRVKKVIGNVSQALDLNQARLKALQLRDEAMLNKIKTSKVIDEWLDIKSSKVELKTLIGIKSKLERCVVKELGNIAFAELKRQDIISCLNRFNGKFETQKRILNNLKQVYNYAVVKEYVNVNILFNINPADVFVRQNVKNFATMTDTGDISKMFKKIAHSRANFSAKTSLVLNALTALRPGNVISLKWSEIDFKNNLIILSAEKMKTKRDFVLPISTEALKVLEFINKYYRHSNFVFPSITSKTGYISDNTTRKLIRELGYDNTKFTPHGFRAMFSTLANDNSKDSDVVERCLAHVVGGVKGVYDRSEKLEQKRELMGWWGEFIAPFLHIDEVLDIANL